MAMLIHRAPCTKVLEKERPDYSEYNTQKATIIIKLDLFIANYNLIYLVNCCMLHLLL